MYALHTLTAVSAAYHILVITAEKFLAIAQPLRHHIVTKKAVFKVLAGIWLISAFIAIIPLSCAVQNKGSALNSLQLTKFIQHGFSCYTVICIHHAVESLFSFVPCVINSFGLITQCTLINAA